MQWSSYEIFSVLSGMVLLAVAVAPGVPPKDRAWSVVGGVFFVGYGFYVATQTTGTWTFPAIIFIIPFAVAGHFIYTLAKRKGMVGNEDADESQSPRGNS